MTKKLTVSELNKLSKELEQTQTYPILNGQFEVAIKQNFKESSINNIFTGLIEVVQGIEKSQLTELTFSQIASQIGSTLMLREFTDLPIPNKNDFQTLIKVYENLLNTNIFVEVANKLPEIEVKKLEKRFKEIADNFAEIERKANEEMNSNGANSSANSE
ncbi:hypothetical protein HFE03_07210 [Paenibacillus sp. EKM102P]|uniref:hypothetical protein n=1 Tax=unclassified Paenibacillus TaxID=185978 RepID=UPI00142DB694|nr:MULTISPECIES: hypothetical protein [unclassified Paenibacillus]KAF6620435.1 hypothetical protein HFE00_05115 [Paenibacillus sp. EKM101P]KAF6623427.1 hypothetical protein HFE03_07210 [Paenibacillus sp. EKM102P]KAF6634011.1 hypothetical protein HFE01_07300 [Paenibacillus sp. EKM10P]KAF6649537.1 hypothetical protein HFE02_02260 [Paenibacillus sp. EKM11P]